MDDDPPSFSKFLEKLSSDQRRRIVTIVCKTGQRRTLEKILDDEGPIVQEYYEKWRDYEGSNSSNGFEALGNTNTSPDPACLSDSEDEEDPNNPDNDPTRWTPNISDDFFDDFPEETNILILGETGVGKSTFINALANYLQFGNIHLARDQFDILIKATFTFTDKDYKQRRIECLPTINQEPNEVDNEKSEVGQSSTQAPKSYMISCGPPKKMKNIRIIDTPGIGDSRGTEQEMVNFNKILDFISQYKEIHAICILMKSNEGRLALNFRYCLNELFARLHKSASRNILFCFTNSRETLYRPGDVLATLQTFLNNLKETSGVEIPLNASTMFCFDNESFRYLCAWREGTNFTPEEKISFSRSWKITVKQTLRLLKRISQLPPHKVADTIAVNNLRMAVLTMAKPTAEYTMNQFLNLQMVERKIKEIEDCLQTGTSLEDKLFVEQIELIQEELSEPMTVCTAPGCVEYKKTSEDADAKLEINYKQICHNPCHLEGVKTEICPNPAIKSCYIFQTEDELCKFCKCSWEHHIHLQYRLDKKVKKIVDPVVADCLKKNRDTKNAAELFLVKEKKRKKELEKASNFAMTHSAEFAAYLKENCLVPYNDVYKEYMDQLIRDQEKLEEEGGSAKKVQALQAKKEVYDKHVQAIERQRLPKNGTKTAEEMHTMVEKFKNSKDCVEVLKEARKIELIDLEKKQTSKDVAIKTKGGWFENACISCVEAVTKTTANVRNATRVAVSKAKAFLGKGTK